MQLSISQLSELTGRERRTVANKLADVPHTPGDKNAMLYESAEALPLIYAVDNLENARAAQARSQASLNALREEDMRKQRIPLKVALGAIDEAFQSIGATLKAAKGKKLTAERINELLSKWHNLPASLKW